MTLLALVLILISAIAHATWNFLAKRTINQELFIWSMIISISIVLIPLAIICFITQLLLLATGRLIHINHSLASRKLKMFHFLCIDFIDERNIIELT